MSASSSGMISVMSPAARMLLFSLSNCKDIKINNKLFTKFKNLLQSEQCSSDGKGRLKVPGGGRLPKFKPRLEMGDIRIWASLIRRGRLGL